MRSEALGKTEKSPASYCDGTCKSFVFGQFFSLTFEAKLEKPCFIATHQKRNTKPKAKQPAAMATWMEMNRITEK